MRLRADRLKNYIAVVEDTDGVTYQYLTFARRPQEAEREARESAGRAGATLVRIKPAIDRRHAARRRQWLAAAIALTVTAVTISAIVIAGSAFGSVL